MRSDLVAKILSKCLLQSQTFETNVFSNKILLTTAYIKQKAETTGLKASGDCQTTLLNATQSVLRPAWAVEDTLGTIPGHQVLSLLKWNLWGRQIQNGITEHLLIWSIISVNLCFLMYTNKEKCWRRAGNLEVPLRTPRKRGRQGHTELLKSVTLQEHSNSISLLQAYCGLPWELTGWGTSLSSHSHVRFTCSNPMFSWWMWEENALVPLRGEGRGSHLKFLFYFIFDMQS